MSTTTTVEIKTADEYREMARDCQRREHESWERSDTDGFLSQWALQQMASRYHDNARIVEQGGVGVFVIVEIATGKIIATNDDQREGQYGYYYLIDGDAADRVGRFLSLSKAQNEATAERNDAKKGVRTQMVFVPLSECYESRKTDRIEAHEAALKGTVAS